MIQHERMIGRQRGPSTVLQSSSMRRVPRSGPDESSECSCLVSPLRGILALEYLIAKRLVGRKPYQDKGPIHRLMTTVAFFG